ncbi:MAG: hydroxymethylbilane synthase [Propionibacteriaceae bacterium]
MITIGSRSSPLARAQSDWVAARLAEHGVEARFVGITTAGDTDRRQLTQIGGTGVFVAAVRAAVADGRVDLAVHSTKDLPTAPAPGLTVGAICERADVRDVLVGSTLATLRSGMRVGTGSPRRAVQLDAWAREQGIAVEIVPIRGNVGSRLDLVASGRLDAVVLAAAGLVRLGRLRLPVDQDQPARLLGRHRLEVETLEFSVMLPAAGQGALAVEISESASPEIVAAVHLLDVFSYHAEVAAERAFLATLEAGCLSPIGVAATAARGHGKSLDLTMAAVIGKTLVDTDDFASSSGPLLRLETTGSATDAARVGTNLARRALDRLKPS